MGNERLRTAMAKARAGVEAVSSKTGVDPKTVQRWLALAASPMRDTAGLVSELLSEEETYLWPYGDDQTPGDRLEASKAELVELYPFLGQPVPVEPVVGPVSSRARGADRRAGSTPPSSCTRRTPLNELLHRTRRRRLQVRSRSGTPTATASEPAARRRVRPRHRIPLPPRPHALPARSSDARHRDPTHGTTLYNSIYRVDDEMLVNTHVYGVNAYAAPVLHLRRSPAATCSTRTPRASRPCGHSQARHVTGRPRPWPEPSTTDDPDAPKANSIVVAVTAVVTRRARRHPPQRRPDNDLWALPGGGMDLGESIAETAVREVKEETGIDVEVTGLVGIYTDPATSSPTPTARSANSSPSASPPDSRRPAAARATSPRRSAGPTPTDLDELNIHPSIRLRISHGLDTDSHRPSGDYPGTRRP